MEITSRQPQLNLGGGCGGFGGETAILFPAFLAMMGGFVYNAGGNPFCGNSCNSCNSCNSVSLNGAY